MLHVEFGALGCSPRDPPDFEANSISVVPTSGLLGAAGFRTLGKAIQGVNNACFRDVSLYALGLCSAC